MTEINLDIDFFNHPKTIRLVGKLGRNSEVLPIKLWCWCAKNHAENGRLTGYSTHEIESAVNWWGTRGSMVKAMVDVGFMTDVGNGDYEVHNWLIRQGHISALKERAKKGAEARWNRIRQPHNNGSNAQGNAKDPPKQCSSLPLLSVLTPPKAPPSGGSIASGIKEGEKAEDLIPATELVGLLKNLGETIAVNKSDGVFCNSSEKIAAN
jgi:hypothetical protein